MAHDGRRRHCSELNGLAGPDESKQNKYLTVDRETGSFSGFSSKDLQPLAFLSIIFFVRGEGLQNNGIRFSQINKYLSG